MDEIERLSGLIELYECALAELDRLGDPALDELVVRLECRAAQVLYEYDELLHPLGARGRVDALPRRSGR